LLSMKYPFPWFDKIVLLGATVNPLYSPDLRRGNAVQEAVDSL
jgi:hypothetical protein